MVRSTFSEWRKFHRKLNTCSSKKALGSRSRKPCPWCMAAINLEPFALAAATPSKWILALFLCCGWPPSHAGNQYNHCNEHWTRRVYLHNGRRLAGWMVGWCTMQLVGTGCYTYISYQSSYTRALAFPGKLDVSVETVEKKHCTFSWCSRLELSCRNGPGNVYIWNICLGL